MSYYCYIFQSEQDGSYYVGSTGNLEERVTRHNQGRSVYTRGKGPWKLVYFEEHPDRAHAMERERSIKKRKSKAYIWELVQTSRA
ncbi:MAG: GIY-YIG nuclease family protein [Desulfobacteraceae bacterium]|jgi:putative endonuclease